MSEPNVPVLDEDGDDWVLRVHGAGPVKIPKSNRALALHVMDAATRAYGNGCRDTLENIQRAIGVRP